MGAWERETSAAWDFVTWVQGAGTWATVDGDVGADFDARAGVRVLMPPFGLDPLDPPDGKVAKHVHGLRACAQGIKRGG